MKNEFYELQQFIYSLIEHFTPYSDTEFEEKRQSLARLKQDFMRYLGDLALRTLPQAGTSHQFRMYQRSMIHTSNRIVKARKQQQLTHPQQQQLCAQAESGLKELLDHLAFEYPEYFHIDIYVPLADLEENRPRYQQMAAAAISLLEEQQIPAEFRQVMLTYFNLSCERENQSYHQSGYFNKICHKLEYWMALNRDESPVYTLHRLLCYYNFNRMDYLNYLSFYFLEKAHIPQPIELRLYSLQQELSRWKNFISSPEWKYDLKQRISVSEYVSNLLKNLIDSLELELTLNPGRSSDDYVCFNYNIGQWCLSLDYAMEKKAFGPKISRRQVAFVIAEHFRTPDNMPLNPETLRRKDLPHKEEDVIALYQYHQDAAKWIKDNYPHLFKK